jgi:hypothetical protein
VATHDEADKDLKKTTAPHTEVDQARAVDGAGLDSVARSILALQRDIGNAAVTQLLTDGTTARRSTVPDVLRAGGKPLPDKLRGEMEARLGADFSTVRLHDDSVARRSAAEIGAKAYTSGDHVVLGHGGTDKHTLAHELTHLIQQRQGPVDGTDNGAGLRISDPADRFEREAEANARRVMSGPAPQGADAPPTSSGGDSASALPVQRVFQGDLAGRSTEWAMAELRTRFPESTVSQFRLNKAFFGGTVYNDLATLASALGLQQSAQPVTTSAPAATTPAPATQQQLPPAPAPPAHTTTPPAPAEERSAEERSVEDFAENSANARDELKAELAAPLEHLRRRATGWWDDDTVFAQLAGSVNISNRNQAVPHLIDQLYSCLEWTGRAPIAVFTHEAQGRGDLMLGVKTADALRENFPRTKANENDIALLTAEKAYDKQPDVFTESGHPFTVLPGTVPEAPPLGAGTAPKHVIVAPQLSATKNFQQSLKDWDSTVSAMTEYSKKEQLPWGATGTGYTTGLGQGEVGINFDAGLRAYKRQQDSIGDEAAKRTARLENLQALKSAELLTALFPEDQEQAVKDFATAATSRLYFAYSNKSAIRFALTVAELENGKSDDVHVVQSSAKGMPALTEPQKRELAKLGVAKIRQVQLSSSTATSTTEVQTGDTGKTMHWITTERVPHADMLTLIKASEPIVMTTGNQSTSEALSAGKTIMYESIGMAQSKTFLQALYSGAKVGQADIDRIAAVSRDYDKDQPRTSPPGQPEFKAAAAVLRNMQQEDKMGKFSDQAAATRDLGRWIGGKHLREFLMDTPLAGDLRRHEKDIESHYSKPEAYQDFVRYLRRLPDDAQ